MLAKLFDGSGRWERYFGRMKVVRSKVSVPRVLRLWSARTRVSIAAVLSDSRDGGDLKTH